MDAILKGIHVSVLRAEELGHNARGLSLGNSLKGDC